MVPPLIWTYWSQGRHRVPPVIQLCIQSWTSKGKIDDVRVLDDEVVLDFLSPDDLPARFAELPVQMKSDAVRFALLAKHGGMWMDASTLVSGPIVPWLKEQLGVQDFFVFRNGKSGNGGRLFEIGFIACAEQNPFLMQWSHAFNKFFRRKRLHQAHSPGSSAPWLAKKIFAAINVWSRKTARRSALWAKIPLRWISFYPFFISYYLANKLLAQQKNRNILNQMPDVPASSYLWLRSEANQGRLVAALTIIAKHPVPVHDVEFRFDFTEKDIGALRRFVKVKPHSG